MVTTRELAAERLTVAEAAERLGVSRSSVYRYVRAGRLRPTREGRRLVFDGLDVWVATGYRYFGRGGPPIWSDEKWAEILEADKIELPRELQHLASA